MTGLTRRQILWLSAGAVATMALWAATRSPSGRAVPGRPVGKGWVDSDAPRRIRAIAAPIEQLANWPNLGHYLAGISYIESRGNPRAGSSEHNNMARGWFGHRPKSARLGDLGLGVEALKDERLAVALAAWYAHRCQKFAAPGQQMDWLAVRRCWGFPSDVSKLDHPGYRDKLAKGLGKAGIASDFMFLPAFPPGYQWPGIDAVLAAVGRPRVA